jgi:hypothetical protein
MIPSVALHEAFSNRDMEITNKKINRLEKYFGTVDKLVCDNDEIKFKF